MELCRSMTQKNIQSCKDAACLAKNAYMVFPQNSLISTDFLQRQGRIVHRQEEGYTDTYI